MNIHPLYTHLATILFGMVSSAADDPLLAAKAAFSKQDYRTAVKLALETAKAEPKNLDATMLLGAAYLRLREPAEAAAAYTRALEIDPKSTSARDSRGDAYLHAGEFNKAVADFDAVLEANPRFAPQHWRRGIALYYAGRFKDGVKQFETHQTANPEDVENAAWHFLCNSQVVGIEKAKKTLIAVTQDTRVPMAEIQKLFAGKLEPKDVLAAADKLKQDSPAGVSARFYANLYVALWHDAAGEKKKVREHLTVAVEKFVIGDYMWDVANAHLKMLKTQDKK